MRLITVILAVLMLAAIGNAQSYVDCIINNFQKNGNMYSFDLRANQTSGPAINVGTSAFRIKVNPNAFTYLDGALYANITLMNINPRYSGGWNFGDGNYRMMTRTTYTQSGSAPRCEFIIDITHWDGYPSSELLPNELLCTVRLQIFDSSKTTGISWYITGGMAALPPGSVINTFVGSDDGPLPITLSSFNVNAMNGSADLRWTTISEMDNYGFYVQRGFSKDNLSDAEQGFVAGHGTTLQRQEYSWTDRSPATYYRLRQVDLDGTSHFTDVIAFTPTNIESNTNNPVTFTLEQNYPNPFNPSTTIKYELPKVSEVRLSLYDVLGREVAVLVNERRDAGVHEVKFDGSGLLSGVYFYRMEAGSFVETKRLLLIK
jgi:hypothetical protein